MKIEEKFLKPIHDRNNFFKYATMEEKIEALKYIHNLSHGKGKRKKKIKKNKK